MFKKMLSKLNTKQSVDSSENSTDDGNLVGHNSQSNNGAKIPKRKSNGSGLRRSSSKPKTTSKLGKRESPGSKGLIMNTREQEKKFENYIQENGSFFNGKENNKSQTAPSVFSDDSRDAQKVLDDINSRIEENSQKINVPLSEKNSMKNRIKGIKVSDEMREYNKRYSNLIWKMYSYKLFNWALEGQIDKKNPNLNGSQFQVGYTTVFTKKNATRYYLINSLPEDTPVLLYNHLKDTLRDLPFWNKVSVQILNEPYSGDLRSPSMQMKIASWTQQIESDFADIDENFIVGLDGEQYQKDYAKTEQLKFLQRMLRSYFKLVANARHSNKTTMVIKLQTLDESDIYLAETRILDYLDNLNSDYQQIRGRVLDFLRGFSMVSRQNTLTRQKVQRLIMTNKNLAELGPLRQGKFGSFGLPFGLDKFSGKMVWLDLLGTSDAKNIYITGLTGSGKSFFLSVILFFAKALGIRIFIEDSKGTEFREFTLSNNGVIISQTPRKMSYVNKWVIPSELALDENDLKGMYTEMVSMTQLEFMTIVEPEQKNKKAVEQIFSEFMRFVHGKFSIEKQNTSTYFKTKDVTPQGLYDIYCTFIGDQNKHIQDMFDIKLLNSIKLDLANYWDKNGSRSELYKSQVNIEEMCKNNIVTFDLGIQESIGSNIDKEDKLKTLNYETACSYYKAYNKKHGLTTIVVKEEVQSSEKDLLKITARNMTQGRSGNLINIVLGNASGALFKEDDPIAASIRENFTVLVLGKVTSKARKLYVEEYDLERVEYLLDAIAEEPEFKRCFLVHSNITGQENTTVARWLVPFDVAESKYFKTVDHTGNKDVEIVEERI